jgi:DNA-binding NarL/FixJ family response regulator
LVDDAILITKRIAEMLNDIEGIADILISNSYASALENLTTNEIDIVLLDIHLPEQSGIELLELIRREYDNIKVLMVTNKVSQYYKDLCTEKGAHHFIDKSKEFETIPVIVQAYCNA